MSSADDSVEDEEDEVSVRGGGGFRFFQDWWAEVTQGAKNDGSFSEMMGPSISN